MPQTPLFLHPLGLFISVVQLLQLIVYYYVKKSSLEGNPSQ
ncbi:Hypothetical protein Ccan_01050 [Capnocytophaga canimorsus Cc5]|uniref:Uncharacterized protein n=1 Tax=Capnocytophaga canimorsus (strain 5) TaxID=860228 RepID=F9YPY2_CAPCC|nr:Hypothetical protein Ccan_01050 [Capnocytophaga canimorsus Cc5]